VDYAVSEKTVSATDDRIAYKVVTVTVKWTGPPQPAKDVVLTTMLYRQYSGPTLVDFIVDPSGLVVIPNQPPSPDPEKMVQNPVALYATVNDADIASMRPRTVGATERAGRVDFSVTSSSGTVFPTDSVPCTVDSTVVFQSAWSPPTGGGGDGYHTFKAVAYSAMGSPGPSWQLVYRVETGPPAAVTNLIGTAALEWAMITWNASVTGDVDHYEVWRDGQLLPLAAHIDPAAGSMGYTDDTLDGSNGTSYEYKVRAVDWMDNYTAASTIPNILVSDDPANVVPLPASNFEGQAINDKARLAWVGPAGVLGYQVYQTIDGETNTFTTASATLDVEQGWGTTALYQVKPFVAGGVLATDYATLLLGPGVIVDSVAWLEVTIDPERLYTLTVTNTTKSTLASLRLYYLGTAGATPQYEITPSATNVAKNATHTWSGLHAGKYTWGWVTSNNKRGSQTGSCTGETLTITGNTP